MEQCTGKVGDKVGDKVHDKSATLSKTCPGLCCKVGVMEFGLYGPALTPAKLAGTLFTSEGGKAEFTSVVDDLLVVENHPFQM